MRLCRAALIATALSGLEPPRVAHAGPVEQVVQVAMHPTDPGVMAVRYEYGGGGLFVTADGGKSWKLSCGAAMFSQMRTSGGPLVITGGGTMSMGVFTGILHDDGHACAWSSEPQYDGVWVSDLAVDPLDPSVTYAVTSTGSKPNGMLRRDASGSWSDLGTRADLLISDLHVVPHGSGVRFYVGAVRIESVGPDGGASLPTWGIRVSDDDGATWREHPYGVADGTVHLQAVDPTNPDRVVVSIERAEDGVGPAGSTDDSVLVSDDEGATFTEYLKVTEIGGVAFAPDGRVWIGDAGSPYDSKQPHGLWGSPTLGAPATRLPMSDYPVQCLGYQTATDTLYACQRWSFGPVDTADGSFRSSLDVTQVTGFVGCEGVDMAAACEAQLCGAYCGFGHFAQAPVCCAYSSLTCGPKAAEQGTGTCGSAGGAGGGGGGTASVADTPGGAHSSGGCSAAPAARSGPLRSSTFATLFALALVSRRRWRPRRGALTSRCSSRR